MPSLFSSITTFLENILFLINIFVHIFMSNMSLAQQIIIYIFFVLMVEDSNLHLLTFVVFEYLHS